MRDAKPASEDVAFLTQGPKIIQIILVFCQVSQSDVHVRNALGTRMVVRSKCPVFKLTIDDADVILGLMRACELLEPIYLVQMLKAVKHLSMKEPVPT